MSQISLSSTQRKQPFNVFSNPRHKNPISDQGDHIVYSNQEADQWRNRRTWGTIHLLIAPNLPSWDPHTEIYKDQEFGMVNCKGSIKSKDRNMTKWSICSVINRSSLDAGTDSDRFISSINVIDQISIGGIHSEHIKGRINALELVERLNIPIEMAKRTLTATT